MKRILVVAISFVMLFISCKRTTTLTAKEIIQRAHEKAGGSFWQQPKSLTMKGHGIFYRNGTSVKHETHNMWREFEQTKNAAHIANGKVRIESFRDSIPVFIITYDGQNTYDLNGKQKQQDADKRWSSNFGYGAIRHALDEGYRLEKVANDTIKNNIAYTIKVIDPNKGETFFGIDATDFKIVKVAFQTPRGWHHREYSEFFSKEGYSWLQAGRVELFYDGKLSNEVFWEDFEVNEDLPDSLFVLK